MRNFHDRALSTLPHRSASLRLATWLTALYRPNGLSLRLLKKTVLSIRCRLVFKNRCQNARNCPTVDKLLMTSSGLSRVMIRLCVDDSADNSEIKERLRPFMPPVCCEQTPMNRCLMFLGSQNLHFAPHRIRGVSTSLRIWAKLVSRKGTDRLVSENIAANLGCLWSGTGDKAKGSGEFLSFGPQNTGFCRNERNREEYQDGLYKD
jgi:hypothetical protein